MSGVTYEFEAKNLRVRWRANPLNSGLGINGYFIVFTGATSSVTHFVSSDAVLFTDDDGLENYSYTLAYEDLVGIGLTRSPLITLKTQGSDGSVTDGPNSLVVQTFNPKPHFTVAPKLTESLDSAVLHITRPDSPDVAAYLIHRLTAVDEVPSSANLVGRGLDTNWTLELPSAPTGQPKPAYYFAVAPLDSFDEIDPIYVVLGPVSRQGLDYQEVTERLQTVEQVAETTRQGVADLELTYGDTVSAAASASAAANDAAAANTAKADAIIAQGAAQSARDTATQKAIDAATSAASANTAKGLAETAKTAAETARAQAQTAKTAAETAQADAVAKALAAAGSASTASGHATTASQKADAAAGSATAASGSATVASTKAGEASTSAASSASSATDALGSKNAAATSATTAATARDAAAGSATAAASSATTAGTHATNAGTSANAANTAKLAAETARSQAQTSASNAADSATTAAGSAATASSAATQSATARDQSQGFANAANTSAQNAAGSATTAGNSASAANTAKTSAEAAYGTTKATAISLMPVVPSAATLTQDIVGSPETRSDLPVTASGGNTISTGASNLFFKGLIPWVQGNVLELEFRIEGIGTALGHAGLYYNALKTDLSVRVQGWSLPHVPTPVGSVITLKQRVAMGVTSPGAFVLSQSAENAFVRFGALINRIPTGSSAQAGAASKIHLTSIRDVTALAAAEASAAAAATSSSNAAASATQAGEKAAAAQVSATNADTSRANAATSASQASQSETNAAGSATAASISAGAAASSKDAAAGSATAASGHANTAGTKATEAENSATAAAASSVAASSSKDAAALSATAASTSASSAATSATAAGTSASAANAAKLAAETAQGSASTSATNAANSATNAAGSASTATTQAGLATSAKDAAAGSASAANTSAGNAASSATAAGNSASAANTSKVAAESAYNSSLAAAIAGFPDVLASDLLTNVFSGPPATRPGLPTNAFVNGAYTPAFSTTYAIFKQDIRWREGAVYELTADVEGTVNGTQAPHFRLLAASLREDYTDRGVYGISTVTQSPVGSTTKLVWRVALGVTVPGATRLNRATDVERLRFGVHFNTTATATDNVGARSTLKLLKIRDVTTEVATQSVYDKTVILGGNQGFEDGLTGWGPLSAANPGIFGVNGDGPTYQATYQGRNGVAVVSPGIGRRNIYSAKLFPIDTTRKYRIRTSVYVGPGAAAQTYVGFRTLDAAGVTIGGNGGHQYVAVGGVIIPENTGWKEYVSAVLSGEGAGGFTAGTKLIQLCAFLNYAGANGTSLANTALDGIWLEDVTESEAAKAQATAAATSASNAAASSTAAGQQATAAQTAKTAAETAKGLAETAASQASSSATNAAGSASTASTAATNAATSRDQASGFATAASGSASTASTKANEAGNSAAAAAASQVSASAAKDAAVSAKDGAETARGQAQSSASAAATSASSASASATTAGEKATAASGSATVASTKAGEASTFAGQASSSAAAANSASTSAGTAATAAQGVATRLMPDRVSGNTDFYDANAWAAPENTVPLAPGTNVTTPDQGLVRQFTGSLPVASRGWRKIEPGRTYRFTSTSRIITGAAGNIVRNGFIVFDANAVPIDYWFEFPVRPTAAGWVTDVRSISATELLGLWPNAVYIRPCVHSGIGSGGTALPGVVWQVSVLRSEDVTESASAAASAATAVSQAAAASASASSASISANLAASMANSNPNVLPNSTALGMEGWTNTSPNGEIITAQQAADGPRFAFGFVGTEGAWSEPRYRSEKIAWGPGMATSISAEVYATGMKWGEIRFYLEFFNASGESLGYQVAKHDGSTDWRKIQNDNVVSPPGTAFIHATIDTYGAPWNVGGSAYWRKLKVENSTASTPWNDFAQSQMVAEVLAKANYLQARWKQVNAVPGAATFITAEAENNDGTPNSSVAIGARQVMLYNQIGGDWKKALEVVNGNALFSGGLQAGAYIRLGNGNGWPVALKAVDFLAADGEVVSFGTDLGSLPSLSFALDNLAPLNTGETYNVYAENLSPTGFTLRAKINIPAPLTNQQSGTYEYADTVGGLPGRTIYLEGKPPAPSGSYRVRANGYQEHRLQGRSGEMVETGSEDRAYTSLQIWTYNGSTWRKSADVTAESMVDPYSFPANQWYTANANWVLDEVLQLGSGITHVAVVRVGADNGRAGEVYTAGPVYWQSQGAGSGVRSATPTGQKTRITVRPQ